MVRSREMGIESRYIAVREFGVPEAYYNHSVINHMNQLKRAALEAKEGSDYHKNLSWPRLIALAVFTGFQYHCEQCQMGNPKYQAIFDQLKISPESISKALETDADNFHR